ncbi:MAG: hypothetical protein KGJ13_09265 [Patescibacteria group bacterium]|nr:hypothetical protein [Patescibacteria group bacterium]
MGKIQTQTKGARPSIRARFAPYLERLLDSIAREEWLDAALDLEALDRAVQRAQLDEKLKDGEALRADGAKNGHEHR